MKVGNGSKRHDRKAVSRTGGRHEVGNGPQSEMTAGRVTEEYDPRRIDRVLTMKASPVSDRGPNVIEGAGPPTTLLADAPILDVPRSKAVGREDGGDVPEVLEAVPRAPVPAVQQDDERRRSVDVIGR
jgi:hypothetical protein